MSTLVSYSKVSPYGKEENCAQFGIVDIRETFTLQEILSPGEEYTFSFWVSSDEAGGLTIGGTTISTSSLWEKHSIPFVAVDTNFTFGFAAVGTYYIYHPKLEFGTISTDWSPAPEDVDDAILDGDNKIHMELVEQRASIISDCEQIVLEAVSGRVTTTEFGEFMESVETQFTVQAGMISANFETTSSRLDGLTEEVQNVDRKYSKHIQMSDTGIEVIDSNGVYEIQVDNVEGVVIRKDGNIRSQLKDDDFYTGNIVIEVNERAQFGRFAYIPRSDGSLSFLKVGG